MSVETSEISAEEARTFQHFSVHNALQAQQACPEGTCQAYRDIFTYRRWRAQGYQVRRGETGTAVTTWIATTRIGEDAASERTTSRSWSAVPSGPCCSVATRWPRPSSCGNPANR